MSDNRISTPDGVSGVMRISAGKALALFVCCWIFSWAIGLVAIGFVGGATLDRIRLAVVLQDLIIFMLPVAMTMLIAAWRPWHFIGIDRSPGWFGVCSALFTLVVAIPAMNCVVGWNESIHFPESMADFERLLRAYESTAGAMIESLLGGTGVADLIVSVLIIGSGGGMVFPGRTPVAAYASVRQSACGDMDCRDSIQCYPYAVFRFCAKGAAGCIFRISLLVERFAVASGCGTCIQQFSCSAVHVAYASRRGYSGA